MLKIEDVKIDSELKFRIALFKMCRGCDVYFEKVKDVANDLDSALISLSAAINAGINTKNSGIGLSYLTDYAGVELSSKRNQLPKNQTYIPVVNRKTKGW